MRAEGPVRFAELAAPPMNLLGPDLVGDLVSLIERAEADDAVRVLVFRSADPGYFIAGGGALQHLPRPAGPRPSAEVLLSGEDYDMQLAERCGWSNRALPADELGGFVSSLARRIAGFPSAARVAIKDRGRHARGIAAQWRDDRSRRRSRAAGAAPGGAARRSAVGERTSRPRHALMR